MARRRPARARSPAALARHLGYAYLDTGLLYRAVGMKTLERGAQPSDPVAATKAAEELVADEINRADLRSDMAANAASRVAAIPSVRRALLAFQRRFAERRPAVRSRCRARRPRYRYHRLPEGDLKLFITASPEVRAARRLKELRERGLEAIDTHVLREMQERDARDCGRVASPLEPASDAIVIDTSGLDPDAVFAAALAAFATARLE